MKTTMHHKFIAVGVWALFSFSVQAEQWVRVAVSEASLFYLDKDSVTKTGSIYNINIKRNSKLEDKKTSNLYKYSVNCERETLKLNDIQAYSALDLMGDQIYTKSTELNEEKLIIPNSIGAKYIKVTCEDYKSFAKEVSAGSITSPNQKNHAEKKDLQRDQIANSNDIANGQKQASNLANKNLAGQTDCSFKDRDGSYEGQCGKGSSGQPLPNGNGKFIFKNGDIYEGNFKNGQMTGKGKSSFTDGSIIECDDFSNGKSNGKCSMSSKNGEIFKKLCYLDACFSERDKFGNISNLNGPFWVGEKDALISPASPLGKILSKKLMDLDVDSTVYYELAASAEAACRAGNRICQSLLSDKQNASSKMRATAKEFATLWNSQSDDYKKRFASMKTGSTTVIYPPVGKERGVVWVSLASGNFNVRDILIKCHSSCNEAPSIYN